MTCSRNFGKLGVSCTIIVIMYLFTCLFIFRQDIFYSGSVLAIPQFRSQPDCRSYVKSITTIPGEFRDEVDGITSRLKPEKEIFSF